MCIRDSPLLADRVGKELSLSTSRECSDQASVEDGSENDGESRDNRDADPFVRVLDGVLGQDFRVRLRGSEPEAVAQGIDKHAVEHPLEQRQIMQPNPVVVG